MKLVGGLYLLSDDPSEMDLRIARSLLATLKREVANRGFFDRMAYRLFHDRTAMQIDVLEADLRVFDAYASLR